MESKLLQKTKSEYAFTLVELLVVLGIISTLFALTAYSVVKFKQIITVSNASKELVLYLRDARRRAIDNVVTSRSTTPEGYYIHLVSSVEDTDVIWGECDSSGCYDVRSIKSEVYKGVTMIPQLPCSSDEFVYFRSVTGEISLTNNLDNLDSEINNCTIEVKIEGVVNTLRVLEVSATERTIKIQY